MKSKPIAVSVIYLNVAILVLVGCKSVPRHIVPPEIRNHTGEAFGALEVNDPAFFELVPATSALEKLASGFDWSEGPVWIKEGGYVVFSDVPSNTVYRWKQGEGIHVYLKPSGYTGEVPRGGEPGSNGLTVDSKGQLVLCEHGDRRVGRIDRGGKHVTLADQYDGRRFNSPNDLVYRTNGDLYFTDPPYGLEKNVDDPAKELPFQGVYRVRPDGNVTLLTSQITRPNGIAFSPDEKTLYVAVSDSNKPVIMSYDVLPDGTIENGRVFFDTKPLVSPNNPGVPDGLKVDHKGNLFVTGPGGVLIVTPKGQHLGTIRTGEATSNCGWGDDGSVLYITADMFLARIRTTTKGLGW
jgi:gluconolactonase